LAPLSYKRPSAENCVGASNLSRRIGPVVPCYVAFRACWAPALSALFALACSGKISEGPGEGNPGDDPKTAGSGATANGTGGSSAGTAASGGAGGSSSGGAGGSSGKGGSTSGGTGGEPAVSGVLPVTRVARLTHEQYQNTVNDLFGIDDDSSAAFAPDALDGLDFDTSLDFRVDSRLGPQYRAAAEALAQKAVSDDSVFARLVSCDTSAASCEGTFIASFGQKAFRRPLTSAETTRFSALFEQGPDLVASGDDFKDGVSLVVESMLQSPQFLYRTELSATAGKNGLIALDDWELATRLSYFLWNTTPSDALLKSASAGTLNTADQVKAAAAQLVVDSRATAMAVSFHRQAWDGRFSHIAPDAKTYPNAPTDLLQRVTDATQAFYGDVVDNDGGLKELLTAPYAFADSALAPLYGAKVSGSALTRVDFDASVRKGLLMQVGYLASNAYAIKTDPIHRGLFVVRNLLCHDIPDPPPGAAQTPLPATSTPPKTTREEVALLTGQSASCLGCHSDINPPGYAFEGFDAVGQVRTDEDGEPLDTTGEMALDGSTFAFAGATDLVDALAASSEAKACYAGKWLAFAYGRKLVADDAASQASLTTGPASVRELMQTVALTPSFMSRAPNEVGP